MKTTRVLVGLALGAWILAGSALFERMHHALQVIWALGAFVGATYFVITGWKQFLSQNGNREK